MTIVIVDYEVGNFRNVQRAFEAIETASIISRDVDVISNASGIVLPGVGAFGAAMDKIEGFGLDKVLIDRASHGAPILAYAGDATLSGLEYRRRVAKGPWTSADES